MRGRVKWEKGPIGNIYRIFVRLLSLKYGIIRTICVAGGAIMRSMIINAPTTGRRTK